MLHLTHRISSLFTAATILGALPFILSSAAMAQASPTQMINREQTQQQLQSEQQQLNRDGSQPQVQEEKNRLGQLNSNVQIEQEAPPSSSPNGHVNGIINREETQQQLQGEQNRIDQLQSSQQPH